MVALSAARPSERRAWQRYPARLPVAVQSAGGPASRTYAADLSEGGFSFYAPADRELGDPVEVVVPLSGERFALKGVVVNRMRDATHGRTRVGVRLDGPTPEFARALKKEVRETRGLTLLDWLIVAQLLLWLAVSAGAAGATPAAELGRRMTSLVRPSVFDNGLAVAVWVAWIAWIAAPVWAMLLVAIGWRGRDGSGDRPRRSLVLAAAAIVPVRLVARYGALERWGRLGLIGFLSCVIWKSLAEWSGFV